MRGQLFRQVTKRGLGKLVQIPQILTVQRGSKGKDRCGNKSCVCAKGPSGPGKALPMSGAQKGRCANGWLPMSSLVFLRSSYR